jgi:hypothetical protein
MIISIRLRTIRTTSIMGVALLLAASFVLATAGTGIRTLDLALSAFMILSMCLQVWYTIRACEASWEEEVRARSRRTAYALHTTTTIVFCGELFRRGDGDNGFFVTCVAVGWILTGALMYTVKDWSNVGRMQTAPTEADPPV